MRVIKPRYYSLIVSAVLVFGALAHAAEDDFSRSIRFGTEEAQQGNLSAALADLRAAVNLEPNNSTGWYELGLVLGQVADFRAAEAAFRRAIELKPDDPKEHYNLALTLTANPQSKLDWPGAIRELHEALKYQPDYPEGLSLLGSGLTSTGQTNEAIAVLERAVRLSPSLATAHFDLAIALEKSNRLDEAAKEYERAAATGDFAKANSGLGKLLFGMGRRVEAERELEKALRLNPDLAEAHYVLARVLESLHRSHEATIEFDETKDLLQREPDGIQSLHLSNAGLELAAKGDFAGAVSSLRKAILLKPNYGIPHFNLGLILADMGELGEAAQEMAKAISLLPGEAKPWLELGRILQQQGETHNACEAIAWAAYLSPSDPAILSELASFPSMKSAKSDVAQRALSVHQPDVGAQADTAPDHIAFAAKLSSRGDSEGAIGELLRTVVLQPANIDARRQLASAYQRVGDHNHAVLEYYKILRINPEDTKAHTALGKAR